MNTRTNRRPVIATLAVALLMGSTAASAQETAPSMSPEQQAMMAAWQKASTPGEAHTRLAEHMAGTWEAKQTIWMDPAAPPMTSTGKAVYTPVFGGRHIRMDYSGQFMGQPFEGVGYTSHDNVTGRYVSTWMDSMSTGAFQAEGEYDEATATYTFRGEMADPMGGGAMTPVREVVRVVDADRHVMEMHETRDGQERKTMEIEFTRVAD